MRLSMEEVQKQHESTKKLYEQGLTVAPVDVKRVLDLYDTIEALQQEIEQLADETIKLMRENAQNSMRAESLTAEKDELVKVLKQAREALNGLMNAYCEDYNCPYEFCRSSCEGYNGIKSANKALAAIDKAIGGKEDAR